VLLSEFPPFVPHPGSFFSHKWLKIFHILALILAVGESLRK